MYTRLFLLAVILVTGCTSVPHIDRKAPPMVRAAADLKYARRGTLPAEARAAFYLDAAASVASLQAGPAGANPTARRIYGNAAAELTELLHSADGGRLWNQPLVLNADGMRYSMRFTPKARKGVWAPDAFTDFKLASKVRCGHLRRHLQEPGVGGLLVGIHKTPHPILGQHPPFEPGVGLVAPVTATLDFRGNAASLTLCDPAVVKTVQIQGKPQPLAADFTAPIAYYPPINQLWYGLMGLIEVDKYMRFSGLYMLQPYDPNRIPVILVHGLISTPHMWGNVINELEAEPALRGRYQFWTYCYPTGNTPAYSALLLRKELEKIQRLHPMPHGCIMIGHSMGGLISRMQVTTTGRVLWNGNFGGKADKLYARLPKDHPVKEALIFNADPQVKKVVFICVPHRGSNMALSSIGAIGRSLITLPATIVVTMQKSVIDVLKTSSGEVVMPNSITGLSPKSNTLLAMDKLPIAAPHYSIIGDRGRGDSPNSSDGVVPYWSSHLASASAERIVPGPHGSYELPQTIAELKRILSDHLKTIR
ncbi:MAG: hypothetical protein PHQ12_12750 [Chthoniobacteraceae bacterium]|nr:hypothetical protein [Chthoniobacteraceae bacterium]